MNTPTPLSQVQALRAELVTAFPERREVIDGALEAVLAREHVLLLGPPGTAKSALVRAIAQAFGGIYFERLLTKFSTPEELAALKAEVEGEGFMASLPDRPSTLVRRLDAFEGLQARANLYRNVLQVRVDDLEATLLSLTASVENLLNQKAV